MKDNLFMIELKFKIRLRELRKEKNLTQKQLGQVLGFQPSTIGDWESGRNEPSLIVIMKLARYFDVTTDYLLGLVDY